MKYIKYLAMFLLPLSFMACSDDEESINGGNATVGFASDQITVKETDNALLIPINVTGDHTGLINARVELQDAQGNSVTPDETIIMTSGNFRFPAGVETVDVEIYATCNTRVMEPGRSYALVITDAQGATIGTSRCQVNIEEVPDPYEQLLGSWTFVGSNILYASRPQETMAFTLAQHPEDTDLTRYTCTLTVQGAPFTFDMNYIVNPAGLEIVVDPNVDVASDLDFEMPEWGLASVRFGRIYMAEDPATGKTVMYQGEGGNVTGSWSDELKTLLFSTTYDDPETGALAGLIYNEDGESTGSLMFAYSDIVLIR